MWSGRSGPILSQPYTNPMEEYILAGHFKTGATPPNISRYSSKSLLSQTFLIKEFAEHRQLNPSLPPIYLFNDF